MPPNTLPWALQLMLECTLQMGEVSKVEPTEPADQKWFVKEWEVYVEVAPG